MHFRLTACVAMAALCVMGIGLRPACGGDPERQASEAVAPQQARKAIERGLTFLVKDALKWRTERECATCHHGTMTVWALAEGQSRGYEVDAKVLADMTQWTKARFLPGTGDPKGKGPVAGVPLIYLGIMSQNLPVLSRDEINWVAQHLRARQTYDGVWDSPPPKNGPPPTWESRETQALLGLLAWAQYVPADPKEAAAARADWEKAVAWLDKTKPTDTTQSVALRLLFEARVGAAGRDVQHRIESLLKRQNADGGWSQTKDMPSDAYATGQVLYALSFRNVKNDRPEIQRAVSFLVAGQREDGSWPMASRRHPDVKPFTYSVPITYFGSAWATLGMVRSVPAASTKETAGR